MPFIIQNHTTDLSFPDGAGGFVLIPHGTSEHASLPESVLHTIRESYLAHHEAQRDGYETHERSGSGLMTLTETP